jgi:hypothetical protein
LNKFWKILSGSVIAQNVVSKAALRNARQKLKPGFQGILLPTAIAEVM